MRRKKPSTVKVIQYSSSQPQVIESTYALLFLEQVMDTFSFSYVDNDNHKTYITVYEDEVGCMRIGESNTFCRFSKNKKTLLIKDTDVSTHVLVVDNKNVETNVNYIKVEYDLTMDDARLDTITMSWEIEDNEE